jgi:two-component system sensor histidine kinase UhpB
LASTLPISFLSPSEHASFYRRAMVERIALEDSVPVEIGMASMPRGEPHTMALAPLALAPWALAVGGPEAEVFAEVRRLRLGVGLVAALALSATWMMSYAGARRLVRPVRRLTVAAERIAAGDLETPLQATEGGEIGAMASALESMRQQLLGSITELASWNEDLESRVEDRTRALEEQQRLTQHFARRVITAQEEERGRLSHDLHDGIGQSLTGIRLSVDRAAKSLTVDPQATVRRLDLSRTIIDQAMTDLRRMIADLRPGVLDQLGLLPALQWVADNILRENGVEVSTLKVGLDDRLPPAIETLLFRIGQEAMSNIARHSGATHVGLRIVQQADHVSLSIEDDGCGFEPARIAAAQISLGGIGLAGMHERAAAVGGTLEIVSVPGEGTVIRVDVPLDAVAAAPQTESSSNSHDAHPVRDAG